jgi:hypothetical protein
LDNPSESSGALDINQATEVFANLFDAPPKEPEATPEQEAPTEPETAEAEPEAEVEAEAKEPETAEDDPIVTIKIDGKDVEVPLSELKNGYQRQADYTRKTMEAAETRKAADAERQAALQERQTYQQNLQKMGAQLEGALVEQQKIDWESLIQNDPVEYLRQQHLFNQRQAALQQNMAEQQRMQAQAQAEEQRAYADFVRQQQDELLAKLPDWKDSAKATAEKAAIRQYLVEQGYDENALSKVADHRAVVLAHKAMKYDQMIAKAKEATKKVATLPTKVERPGVGQNPGLDKRSNAFQKLSKSGKVEDAAAVFRQFV